MQTRPKTATMSGTKSNNSNNNNESNGNNNSSSSSSSNPLWQLRRKQQLLKRSLHRLFRRSDPKLFKAIQDDRWDDALELLNDESSDSDVLARYSIKGTTALHCAAKRESVPVIVVGKLMEAYPSAMTMEDKWGATPLHYAVCRASDEVVLEMVKACPAAVKCKDKEGDTALNWALGILNKIKANSTIFSTPYIRESFKYLFLATKMRSPEVISALVEADPSQQTVLLDSSKDLLFSFISFNNWDLRTRLSGPEAEAHPSPLYDKAAFLLKATLHRTIAPTHPTWLPLHAALRVKDCPWSIFKLFLNHHPSHVFLPDHHGDLPIHILARAQPFSDADLYLCLNCNKKPANYSTLYHLPAEDIVDAQTYDWVNRMTDIPINNPIIFGLTNVLTFRIIIYAYFATVLSGLLVLCSDCMHSQDTNIPPNDCQPMEPIDKLPTALKDLLQAYPDSASVPNEYGRLPLHIAIQSCTFKTQAAMQTIHEFFYASPKALSTRDLQTHLFPFMLAAIPRALPSSNSRCCASKPSFVTTAPATSVPAIDDDQDLVELSPSKEDDDSKKTSEEDGSTQEAQTQKNLNQFSTVYNLLVMDPSVLRCLIE